MTIATLDQYIAADRQRVALVKLAGALTTTVAAWYSTFDTGGDPPAGTLAGGNTANGVVPDDTVAGFPSITDFAGGATGYIGEIDFSWSVAGRLALFDCLFKAGAYSFNSAVTLASQPSYLTRTPEGAGNGCQIWLETVTAFTGNITVAVTYTNQAGTAAQSTGTFAPAIAPTLRRLLQMPMAAGDTGVQKIESVTATVATIGTFNVLVLRPLWLARVPFAGFQDIHGLDKTGLPIVYQSSALYLAINTDGIGGSNPSLNIDVVSA